MKVKTPKKVKADEVLTKGVRKVKDGITRVKKSRSQNGTSSSSGKTKSEEVVADARFAHITSDPKYKPMRAREKKVNIDNRFSSMFTDPSFNLKFKMDKRGRRLDKSSKDDLEQYYRMEEDQTTSQMHGEDQTTSQMHGEDQTTSQMQHGVEKNNVTQEEHSDDDEEIRIDLARGEGNLTSSSEEDDEDWEFKAENIEHAWNEHDANAPVVDEATTRLAVLHMDWDRVHARDLYILLSSFCPEGGRVRHLFIYPSQYGRECMAREESEGPVELKSDGDCSSSASEGSEAEEGKANDASSHALHRLRKIEKEKKQMERLRRYQLRRMRYFYAIATCDSVATAARIYDNCDGIEYESSATRVDLRFVPEEETFDDCGEARESFTHEQGVALHQKADDYRPSLFVNTALQQARVRCTWDETDVDRTRAIQKVYEPGTTKNGRAVDPTAYIDKLQAFIASSSGSDDEGDSKLGRLLVEADDDEAERDVDMEVTWESEGEGEVEEEEGKGEAKQRSKTAFQKYMEKRKQKRQERKKQIRESRAKSKHLSSSSTAATSDAQLQLLLDDFDDTPRHFNYKDMKKTDDAVDDFSFDQHDSRFQAVFNSVDFSIEPSSSSFKQTEAMEKLVKSKSSLPESKLPASSASSNARNAEISQLVKSVKRKTNKPKLNRKLHKNN